MARAGHPPRGDLVGGGLPDGDVLGDPGPTIAGVAHPEGRVGPVRSLVGGEPVPGHVGPVAHRRPDQPRLGQEGREAGFGPVAVEEP